MLIGGRRPEAVREAKVGLKENKVLKKTCEKK